MLAIAVTSSLLTVASSASFSSRRLTNLTISTKGYISTSRKDIAAVTNPIRFFQYVVPIVLGRISENTRTISVVIAEMIPNQVLPKRIVA